jgi:1,4-alpha-glucan branching enzyme
VLHFLLSNCRFWLDEYRVDGYRFDGITSMLYLHHGLGTAFDTYDRYFDDSVDEDAVAYLALANEVIHDLRPDAITIAEDVSGMPGLAAPPSELGCGFDYRLAMGVPDYWFHLFRDVQDEFWDIGVLWHELTNRRLDERTISYVECHDQSIVGGKTMMFQLIDAAIYTDMSVDRDSYVVDRGIDIHKLARLATLASAGHGYLNFIGNEFGHPEWVDFPREGNNWSHHYARRQWHLRDDPNLKYRFLADFDAAMLKLVTNAELIGGAEPRFISIDSDAKLLAFERADYFFLFNLHPTHELRDYPLEMPVGRYELVLSSDEARFGGRERIALNAPPALRPHRSGCELRYSLDLSLPPRTAVVLKRTFVPISGNIDGCLDPE